MRGYHEALLPRGAGVRASRSSLRPGLRAGRLPRLLDLAARCGRHDVAAPGRCARRESSVPQSSRWAVAVLVPLFHRAVARADGRDRARPDVALRPSTGGQRFGCIAGAAKDDIDDPSRRRGCAHRCGPRSMRSHVYVASQTRPTPAAGEAARALPRLCAHARGARGSCDAWFGQTFNHGNAHRNHARLRDHPR